VAQDKAPKVLVFKKKRRKQYRRTNGHRQPFTALVVEEIHAG
jgi:large subunit ribosomal protein L21